MEFWQVLGQVSALIALFLAAGLLITDDDDPPPWQGLEQDKE